jgi:WG containing repeat
MKKILSLLGFCVLAFHGFGQVKKIEKRSYGLLDSVYYVNGGDTVCIETYFQNGNLEKKEWKEDSVELYFEQGQIASRSDFHIKHDMNGYEDFENKTFHRHIVYYPDGKILKEGKWQGDTLISLTMYEPNGKIISSDVRLKRKSSKNESFVFYKSVIEKGDLMESFMQDTFNNIYTENKYIKGKLKSTQRKNDEDINVLEYLSYDDNGKIEFKWSLDSNRLHPDKDNGDCVYGLRDMRGDWIIKPQYDNVKRLNLSYFIVNKNEKYGIIDDFGKEVLPLQYDFLGLFSKDYSDYPDYTGEVYMRYSNIYTPDNKVPLRYRIGDKYGVIDFKGQILLPPQYEDVRKMQNDTFEVQIGKKWGLVNGKGQIIVQPKYYRVNFTDSPTIFEVREEIEEKGTFYNDNEILGLINNKGQVLLDMKFDKITQSNDNPEVYFVQSRNNYTDDSYAASFSGIYHLEKGWLYDTTYSALTDGIYIHNQRHSIIIDSILDKKYGYINNQFKTILPFEYDFIKSLEKRTYSSAQCKDGNIENCHTSEIFFICEKEDKFGIFDPKKSKWLTPLEYDYIHEFKIDFKSENYKIYENIVKFLALKNGKWRWIDENGNILSNDLMDYAGEGRSNIFTIKDNIITIFDDYHYPKSVPFEKEFKETNDNTNFLKFKDFVEGDLLVNDKGILVVPPQYFIVSTFGKYTIAMDSSKKQYLFDEKGNKRLFLQQYEVHFPQISEGVVIVEDTAKATLGVVSPEGKILIPLKYYAISALDTSNVIWAKEKSPVEIEPERHPDDMNFINGIKSQRGYTLKPEDFGWNMFDKKGKLLTQTTFAFPFKIHNNHGIGIVRPSEKSQEYKAGIWRTTDGKNILPPQYDRIFYNDDNKIYLIYKKTDLGMKVGVCDTTGKVLIEPKFDKMGVFNGDYAFVEEGGKLGIVMRNGQYKVTPQYNALKNTDLDIEKLLLASKDSFDKGYRMPYYSYNFEKIRFDSRHYNFWGRETPLDTLDKYLQKTFKNLIIEKSVETEFINGENVSFDRSMVNIFSSEFLDENKNYQHLPVTLKSFSLSDINANEKSIGFILGDASNLSLNTCSGPNYNYKTYNYFKNENGKWDEVKMDDLMNLNADNSFKINQLVIDKIRNLKDANIDCANASAYFEQSKDRFYIVPEGLLLLMSQSWWKRMMRWDIPIEILLTWDELKPYLKKKE